MMTDTSQVDGDGYISDDSDFYGDHVTLHEVENQACRPFASLLSSYLSHQPFVPSTLALQALKPTIVSNPYEAQINARQLSESPAEFTARLPASTTSIENVGPWLWVANPHISHNFLDADHASLTACGSAMLADFKTFAESTKTIAGKPKAVISRKINTRRAELEKELKDTATRCGVTSGKWMLFPKQESLDDSWAKIVQGVVDGKLGTAAKVATAGSERKGGEAVRLICVYTANFEDLQDVKRVLGGLVKMGLMPVERSRSIYYKCDAWTHLGIEGSNEFGLKASMYASKDLLNV